MSHTLDPAAAREHLLTDRRGVVEATLECADAVAAAWPDGGTTDRDAVVGPFRTLLAETGLLEAYPAVLAECVTAAGGALRAAPVAAPPYVTVTSTGPVLRATLSGGRLVVALAVFEVDRTDEHPRYVRAARTPETAVAVDVR